MIQFKRGTTDPVKDIEFQKIVENALLQNGFEASDSDDLITTVYKKVYDQLLSDVTKQQIRDQIYEELSKYDGTWNAITLAPGQPGYDKREHKLKVGDGKTPWPALPSVGGLDYDQILSSEKMAKFRRILNPEDKTIFTYGIEPPDKYTVGQVYLHQYDGAIETDYVIETGVDGNWTYRKWNSGLAECWCTIKQDNVEISNEIGSLYISALLGELDYPQKIEFAEVPTEITTATVLSVKENDNSGGTEDENNPSDTPVDPILFLATGKTIGENTEATINTKTKSGRVYIASPTALFADIQLNIVVYGRFERN